ncbi:MAG: bifunctional glutamate N-acetyltransferase/amino-acid acetyltransferase ArgJ [Alphaproteobacteria bacterium]|nr:bifunctional glutamate N-acetyltransferase/amino-acid acetyltransferase ArgJ [Alphaproteobacteria bacterium]
MAIKHPRSPLAPKKPAALKPVRGVQLATLATGLRYTGRDDLLLAVMPHGTAVAGMFTQSTTAAAPVAWCRLLLKGKKARALLINAGNANAATGKAGIALLEESVRAVAFETGCDAGEVFVASTGIIGRPLPKKAIANFVPAIVKKLKSDAAVWTKASKAILTTDTFPKTVSRRVKINGKTITLSGFGKGSGMIAPNMATMLGFVFTDASIDAGVLQKMVKPATDKSFNSITVDGDTSTNDTLLVFATGAAQNTKITKTDSKDARAFAAALEEVLMELAQLIVRDGEGAQKLITIDVTGAENDKAARLHALTIANSPLVKTAIAGEDANWGRILGAAGRSGARLNMQRVKVSIGGYVICRNGEQIKNYDETPVAKYMKGRDVHIELDVGVGKGKARVWTCDLTHGYIDINGSYRS